MIRPRFLKRGLFNRNDYPWGEKMAKRFALFITVLMLVLTVGFAAMAVYSRKLGNSGKYDAGSVDFVRESEQEAHNMIEMEFPVEVSEEQQQNIDEQDNNIQSDIEQDMYNEAVQLGQKVRLIECADEERVIFTFAGDVLLDDGYAMMSNFKNRGSSMEDTFSEALLEKMRNSDVFMLNNEFTFTTQGTPTPDKKFTFRAKPENVSFLKEMGVDVVSLANNHAYDYGEVSLLDTMQTLRDADIEYVGAGTNLNEAVKPLYIIANGMKIAIVSATQIERNATPDTKGATESSAGVLRCMDPSDLLGAIDEAEKNSDFTVLYIHWGTENDENIDWLQEEQAPIYAQAGVDLIIGDHSHCLQRLDCVSGVPVIYSLGNYWFNSRTLNTCLVEVSIMRGALEYFRFIPCIQSDCRTRMPEGDDKKEILDYMRGLSPDVTIDDDGYVDFGQT